MPSRVVDNLCRRESLIPFTIANTQHSAPLSVVVAAGSLVSISLLWTAFIHVGLQKREGIYILS